MAEPAAGATPEAAFDALYTHSASALLRQVRVLTGRPDLARQAVAHAFDLAWQRWPEVARDPDPVGWVRAAAHAYALAPWQRWLPGHRKPPAAAPDAPPLQAALLRLPPEHRRALLLYDGLGLDLPEAAAESESSTAATAGRITRARAALSAELPELEPPDDAAPGGPHPVAPRLTALLADAEAGSPPPVKAAGVRGASERAVRHRTAAAFGLLALIAVATLVTAVVAPEHGTPAPPRHVPQAGPSGGPPSNPGAPAEGAPAEGVPHRAPSADEPGRAGVPLPVTLFTPGPGQKPPLP